MAKSAAEQPRCIAELNAGQRVAFGLSVVVDDDAVPDSQRHTADRAHFVHRIEFLDPVASEDLPVSPTRQHLARQTLVLGDAYKRSSQDREDETVANWARTQIFPRPDVHNGGPDERRERRQRRMSAASSIASRLLVADTGADRRPDVGPDDAEDRHRQKKSRDRPGEERPDALIRVGHAALQVQLEHRPQDEGEDERRDRQPQSVHPEAKGGKAEEQDVVERGAGTDKDADEPQDYDDRIEVVVRDLEDRRETTAFRSTAAPAPEMPRSVP